MSHIPFLTPIKRFYPSKNQTSLGVILSLRCYSRLDFQLLTLENLGKKNIYIYHTSGDLQLLTQETKGLSAAGRKC